jgi:hypothetical protein
MTQRAATIGTECADMAFDAGGGKSGPWAEIGIAYEPTAGDWECLATDYTDRGETVTREDKLAFEDAFVSRLRALVASAT